MSKPDKKAANQKPGKIVLLPVEQIEPSPFQARTAFDETEIAALAVSILQNGLLQPISVRKTGYHKDQPLAGGRLRACRLAKLERIPAIIQDFDDSETAALGLLENLQRAQLDAFDAARGIREVIRLWNCTQAEAARRLGLSQPALANKLRLLTLTTAQQQLCNAARPWPIWRGHAVFEPGGKPPHRRAGKDRTGQAECAGSRPSGLRHAGCPQRHPRPLPQHGADGGGCAAVCKHLTARG